VKEICEHISCTACGACVNVCAKGAIVLVEDSEGFLYPQIDESSCVDCSACVKACPAIKEIPSFSAQFHMAWHKDDDVLKKSSSGGAFTALAEYVLKRGGVVYGAAKDSETWEVCHVMADNAESLDRLRLSKYYQSNTKRVYQEIRAFLEEGRFVLFSGTACQVAGLCSALEHWHVDSDVMRGCGPKRRLITVDVLCHGVTSKKAVMSYIRAKEKRCKKKISDFQFRVKTKDVGWIQGGVQGCSLSSPMELTKWKISPGTLSSLVSTSISSCVSLAIAANTAEQSESQISQLLTSGELILRGSRQSKCALACR